MGYQAISDQVIEYGRYGGDFWADFVHFMVLKVTIGSHFLQFGPISLQIPVTPQMSPTPVDNSVDNLTVGGSFPQARCDKCHLTRRLWTNLWINPLSSDICHVSYPHPLLKQHAGLWITRVK